VTTFRSTRAELQVLGHSARRALTLEFPPQAWTLTFWTRPELDARIGRHHAPLHENIPRVLFHDPRHSHATQLLAAVLHPKIT